MSALLAIGAALVFLGGWWWCIGALAELRHYRVVIRIWRQS